MRSVDLRGMKWIALALLAGAAMLYAVATTMQGRHPAWGYVAAFSEAAMVGSIADWFAVVALFRHPLGLPIPHTAIIPSNKDRIGANLATFICVNFLSTEQVLATLRSFNAAERLANWLADKRHAAQAATHLGDALRYVLGTFDDERVRHFFGSVVLERIEKIDAARLAGQLLDVLTSDRRHQGIVDATLRKLASVLDNEPLKERLAEVLAGEVNYLRFVGLDAKLGRYATTKLIAGVIRLLGEMADDPAHPLRLRFDTFVAGFVTRLRDDPELRARVEAIQRDLLAQPAFAAFVHTLWSDMLDWMRADLARDDSVLRSRAADALRGVGEKLQVDAGMQGWINDQLLQAAPRWIERYREDIRRYIVERVGDWNAQEMTQELERNIGRDLQFIRVNGTLVGGLVGLLIHAATQWLPQL